MKDYARVWSVRLGWGVLLLACLGVFAVCGPKLPEGVKSCKTAADCESGMLCTKNVCHAPCVPSQPGSCPAGSVCQALPDGTGACIPTSTNNNNNNNNNTVPEVGLGEVCGSTTRCKADFFCGKAPHEADFHCRTPCDPGNAQCPAEHFCGTIADSGGKGACFPNPDGAVAEFGKCGGSYGECSQKPLKMVCVVDTKRQPVHGYCLRKCEADGSCRQGYHCIQSLSACAEDCDPSADKCSYGSCRQLSSMPKNPVCY